MVAQSANGLIFVTKEDSLGITEANVPNRFKHIWEKASKSTIPIGTYQVIKSCNPVEYSRKQGKFITSEVRLICINANEWAWVKVDKFL